MAVPMRVIIASQFSWVGLRVITGSSMARPTDRVREKCARASSSTSPSIPPASLTRRTTARMLSQRSWIRTDSISWSSVSRWDRVRASSSRRSQLYCGAEKTAAPAATMAARGGSSSGASTARAIRSAASELTFSAMTAANSSARPPVILRTRYCETPTSWATWRTPTPS